MPVNVLPESIVADFPDAIIAVDDDGMICFCNRAAETLFGFGDGELQGIGVEQLVPMPFRGHHGALRSRFNEDQTSRRMGFGRSVTALRADGSEFEAEIRISKRNNIVIAAIRDTSDLATMFEELESTTRMLEKRVRERTRELERARDDAEAARQAESRFLSNMSHELRNPLNGIVGMLQSVYSRSDIPRDAREDLELALQSSDLLRNLVDDVLDYQKIMQGRFTLNVEPVDMEKVGNALRRTHSSMAQAKGIEYRTSGDHTQMPRFHLGDSVRLQQVLHNVIGNAIKFTQEGYVETHACYENGNLILTVSDTGIGMSEETLSNIFQRFVQGSSGTTKRFGGTGLGLAISKELVQMMGGQIDVKSELGVGSEFRLTIPLPIDEAALLAHREPDQNNELPANVISQLEALTVLVVDDSVINVKVASRLLQRLGVHVDTAYSAREALDKLPAFKFDAVLTDISMPDMDGEEFMLIARQWMPDMPVIAVTGNVFHEDVDRYLKNGFFAVLAKPLDPDRLRDTLSKVSRT